MFRSEVPALALLIGTVVATSAAAQQRSIVGTWHLPGQGCARTDGALTIKPMGIEGEDVTCRFSSVKRTGNIVEWSGVCDDAEGSSRQRVVATETPAGLTLRYEPGGNVIENLKRCAR